MNPFFSIITPTVQRESLLKTCESIESQIYQGWEHIVVVDDLEILPFVKALEHPKRRILCCKQRFNNFGNTPRHRAWYYTKGTYQIALDDDNFLADNSILSDIAIELETVGYPDYSCFPIMRFGGVFFDVNPRSCHADTANMVVKREYAQWPDINDYTADGFWIDALRARPELSMATFPKFRPIVVMPKQGKGER